MRRQLDWKRGAKLLVGGILALSAQSGQAIEWIAANGNFTDDANWQGGAVPDFVDEALINNGGTSLFPSGDAQIAKLTVGIDGGSGNFNQSGGSFLSNGAFIGDNSTGSAVISGGEFLIGGDSIHVGFNQGGVGVMTVSGNDTLVTSGDDFQLGREGTGTLNFSGGTIRAGYTVVAKFGTGTWNQTGGMFDQDFGDVEIGDGGKDGDVGIPGPRTGTINLSGGFMQTADNLAIGNRRGNGQVNISGGVLAASGRPDSSIIIGRGADTSPGAGGDNTLRIIGDDALIVATGSLLMDPNNAVNSATLVAEITGKTHSTIYVAGDADVSRGRLSVELNGYSPVANDSWLLVQAGVEVDALLEQIDGLVDAAGYDPMAHSAAATLGSVLSPFAAVDLSGAPLGPGLAWDVSYTAESILLSIVGGGLAGDFNGNGVLDAADINGLTAASAAGGNDPAYDLNADSLVNTADVNIWAKDLFKSWIGDSDLNGEFSSSDFVTVFTAGKYETGSAAVWTEGDWDGNGRFESADFVAAFSDGGYELGPRAAVQAVPEPATGSLLALAGFATLGFVRRRLA